MGPEDTARDEVPQLSAVLRGLWTGEFETSNGRLWLWSALERLRKRHLLRQDGYARFRAILPLPALVLVWVGVTHPSLEFGLHGFLNGSITVRHLLVAIGAILLWRLASLRSYSAVSGLRETIQMEFTALLRGVIVCGLFIWICTGPRIGKVAGGELALVLAGALLVSCLALLLGAFFDAAQVFSLAGSEQKALIIGSGARASAIRELAQSSHSNLDVVGCLDNQYIGYDQCADNYLGELAALPRVLKTYPIDLVLIGLPIKSHYMEIQQVIDICESIGVETHYMTDVFATSRATHQPSPVASNVALVGDKMSNLQRLLKRCLDLLIAFPMLILCLPALLTIALIIRLTSPGPVLFVQQRYGQNRRLFRMFKFRTMVADAERLQAALELANEAGGPVFKLRADPRITKVGAFLRRTSLDELPQLINVLRGEMSLVGPRPLPLRDVSRFDESWLLRRFSVPPGLTCLWQIKGRSNTKFDEWIRLDLEYIDGWSLGLDLKILAETVPVVLRGTGAM